MYLLPSRSWNLIVTLLCSVMLAPAYGQEIDELRGRLGGPGVFERAAGQVLEELERVGRNS